MGGGEWLPPLKSGITMPRPIANRRIRVLVVGPVGGLGGMAAVARQTAHATRLPDWDIAVVDTAKAARDGAGRIRSLRAHAAQFSRMLAVLIHDRPKIAHLHTCSYLTFVRTMPEILACRVLGARVVLHVHGGFFDRFLNGLHPLPRWIVHAHLRLCHRLIVLGETWRLRLENVVPGLSLEVIPNAVDVGAFAPRATDREGKRLLFVGDLARTKGTDDLIEAVARLPEPLRRGLCVRIVGDGVAGRAAQLNRLATERGVARYIELPGPLTVEAVRREYEAADVFALPSHGEGMPISLLEAMASGLPSVVTDVGAVREMIDDGAEGFVVQPSDRAALADRLAALLADPQLRAVMGRRAAQRARRDYSENTFYEKVDALWRSLVSAPRAGPVRTKQAANPSARVVGVTDGSDRSCELTA